MKTSTKGKGDYKAQRKRRAKRLKNRPPRQEKELLLIDGNFSYYACAYCTFHHGYLTDGLMSTHHCREKECVRMVIPDDQI